MDEIKTATMMPRTIQHAWTITMTKNMQKLNNMRTKMEAVREQGAGTYPIEVAKAEELTIHHHCEA